MLTVVSTPIGNLGDISSRAIQVLQAADLVVSEDTRVTRKLLHHLGLEKPLVSYHAQSDEKREEELLALLRSDGMLALVTDAGTPGISDPGERLIRRAVAEGIAVSHVPGAAAFLSALVVSGLPTNEFTYLGFIPHKKGRQTFIRKLPTFGHTVVFYESPHRIQRLMTDMLEFLPGGTPVVVARELTKMFEEVVRGPLADVAAKIAAKEPKGEYVVVVGTLPDSRKV